MQSGAVLNGKYRLISPIGKGGMGSVWLAQHVDLDTSVALKFMSPELAGQPDAAARFMREAKAAASLRSPHVVQILDYGVDEATGEPFIAMEYLQGESLNARIRREGPLSLSLTVNVITQICRALTLAHNGQIVHRDLKPDNIFLVHEPDQELAKVLDFGIAKSAALASLSAQTATGSVLGTPYYMSPEQITNAKGVDHRSDLWSLAVITCECLTGKRPFEADTAMSLAVLICRGEGTRPSSLGRVPPGFDAWFARGTALDREQRFQSATELSRELLALQSGPVSMANSDTFLESEGMRDARRAERPSTSRPGGRGSTARGDPSMLGSTTRTSFERRAGLSLLSQRSWAWGAALAGVVTLLAGGVLWRLSGSSQNAGSTQPQPQETSPAPPGGANVQRNANGSSRSTSGTLGALGTPGDAPGSGLNGRGGPSVRVVPSGEQRIGPDRGGNAFSNGQLGSGQLGNPPFGDLPPGSAVSDSAASSDVASGNAIPGNAIPGNAVSGDDSPSKSPPSRDRARAAKIGGSPAARPRPRPARPISRPATASVPSQRGAAPASAKPPGDKPPGTNPPDPYDSL